MTDWTFFKKTFSKEQEDAIWQYFIDHSVVQKNGFLGVLFYVKDVDDFWRRVHARYAGDFKRYNKLNKEHKQANQTLSVMYLLNKRKDRIIQDIKRGRNLWLKLLLWANKRTNQYLFRQTRDN